MPPRGKESILRRRKEIERQAKQKEKQARRDERRTQQGTKGPLSKDEISPDDLVSIEELTGLRSDPDPEPADAETEAEPSSNGANPAVEKSEDGS